MRFTIYCRDDSFSHDLATRLSHTLIEEYGEERDDEHPELVVCIGGDGTILRAIHHYRPLLSSLLFCAIHTGTLGFFTDYTKEEIEEFLHDVHTRKPRIESYPLIEAILETGQVYWALNEIRIGSFTSTVHYDIFVDGEYFETVSSCGICVSTQAGSTGANRALNGAVVESGLNILELTQIMPVSHINQHSLISPCIFNKERELLFSGPSLHHSVLCYDHLETNHLKNCSWVKVRLSNQVVRFARFRPYSYLKRLKNLF